MYINRLVARHSDIRRVVAGVEEFKSSGHDVIQVRIGVIRHVTGVKRSKLANYTCMVVHLSTVSFADLPIYVSIREWLV